MDLESLPPLRDVIAAHDLRAKKALGQNFLCDLNLTYKIARVAGDVANIPVFEIGPGPGGLTRGILQAGAQQLMALEYDPRAVMALQPLVAAAAGRLTVVEGDALHTDLRRLLPQGAPYAIIANLPYNIATPLLIGWLKQMREDPGSILHMTLMFQREVADRITAAPGNKIFGRLAVIAQWLCDAHRVFDVPPEAFTPPPNVTSSIVHLTPKALTGPQPAFADVEAVTAAAFGQRRKMLRASLKPFPGLLEAAGIDGTLRAEQLQVGDFIRMASLLDPARRSQ